MVASAGSANGELYVPPGERSQLLSEVETCDAEAETARQSGDQQQALVRLEQGLFLRRRLYAESHAEVVSACRRLCEACNFTATAMLQQENLKAAHDLLKRAEQVAEKNDHDRAITWNNLACYYRRTGKLRAAVSYLERALAIEEHTSTADGAQTHLNLCATLSQLQRHADALFHAQSALIRIYEILSPLLISGELVPASGREGENADAESTSRPDHTEQVVVICIAYHNLAVEHEYLKKFESAICAYAEGLRWATEFLDPQHKLIGILNDSVEAVKAKLPANSPALRRVAELAEGRMATGESTKAMGKDQQMDRFLTTQAGNDGQTS